LPEPTAPATVAVGPASAFDELAVHYDARAGLPGSVGAAVAQAIISQAAATADDLVLELGAGTGEIGAHLAHQPIRYVGLDVSPAMLEVFRAKAGDASPALLVADGDRTWPLADGGAAVVVASRVIHLLDPDHVARETMRVGRPAGLLILGRIVRDDDSFAECLRRRRLDLLEAAGFMARQGEAGTRRVIEGCVARGGISLGRQWVAEWTSLTTPAAIIAGWDSLSRMGSIEVDPATRRKILSELRCWARAELGDLDRPHASLARYALDVVRLR
jgi:SAM-dependent methyltransferase